LKDSQLTIAFILARSFTLSAFALFVDTLRVASKEAGQSGKMAAEWQVLGTTRHMVTSSCGIEVSPTSGFGSPSEFDYIVVVGGLLNDGLRVDNEVVSYLRRAADNNIPLIGVGTGSFILAEAGLMRHHETCVSWKHYQAFRERFPDHRVRADRLFNLDRFRGSCAGGSSAADMAASIVRRHIGKEAEARALEVLQIERARSGLDIQPRRPLSIECDDPRLKAVLIKMERHIERVLPIPELAASVEMSRRQLERLFMGQLGLSPAVAYRKIRLARAKRLLVKSKAPLIEIALETGFESASHFSRLFRQTYGQTPSDLRSDALN
jgi:transcriptional regulator GlxA family with amidase domain